VTQLLGGRYDLQEQIGSGGMAVVYRAVDTMLGREVAVKMLRAQFAGDEEFVARFRREAQSAASLSHPNIVNLYDVGVTASNDYYIVMEYVDGPTLKDLIRERGPLSVKEALDITTQICDALEHAHARQIVHQDIKPHNILLTTSGRVKVTDFGIARAITGNTITLHHDHSVLGSVHYFSPEQARGAPTDAKSDIYSLGVVMYEMLTKRLPFSGDSAVSIALKHLRDDFVDPREWNPELPQSVENIILRCLTKSPEDRYPDMSSLKTDLTDALIHPDVPKFVRPTQALDETIAIPAVGALRAAESEVVDEGNERPKRRRWWMPLIWTVVTLIVIGVGAAAAYYVVMDAIQTPNQALPDVTGKTFAQAEQILHSDGFQDIKEQKANNSAPAGTVYQQSPAGPTEVKPGRTITLYVSNGPQQVLMPNLVGVPLQEAVTTLTNSGIDVASQVTQQAMKNSTAQAGVVVNTTPQAGTPITSSTQIVIQYSKGQMTTVPPVVGLPLDEAITALTNANLKYQVNYGQFPVTDNYVFAITPYHTGDTVPVGTTIGLSVARSSGSGAGNSTGNTAGGGTGNAAGGGTVGNSTGQNTTGNGAATTVSPKQETVNVKVTDNTGRQIAVQVFKTDARDSYQMMVNQTITSTREWNIRVTVTPEHPGQIIVYENGRLVQNYSVPYS
jgi:eukaryotic-like serine/threonine-protein kinase